ncbi:hypothetical protein RIVM261_076550 [Rivularia sp. IAM M-261]|nr:hypothetical protein RIVM261_076550 [Rivularia sp. IAM M-261]
MSISGVTPGDASSFAEKYLQVVDAWLRLFLEKKLDKDLDKNQVSALEDDVQNLNQETESQDIEIRINDKLVYGRYENKLVVTLTPDIIEQLEQLQNTPIGERVDNYKDLVLKVDGQILLQSNSEGEVLVNSFQEEVTSQQEQSESVFDTVTASVNQLSDGNLKTYLSAQLDEMRELHQQQLQLQQQQFEAIIKQRVQESSNSNWWQEAKNNISHIWDELRERLQLHSAASTLKKVFSQNTVPGSNVYYAAEYTINKQGSSYQLNNINGQRLLEFRDTPLGIRLAKENQPLNTHQKQELIALCAQVNSGKSTTGALSPVGQQESEQFSRIEKITKALSDYAKRQGNTVSVDGQFSYKWKASPDGRVLITAKDGRGALLAFGKGLQKSRMSERDLAYFEQILPRLTAETSFTQQTQQTNKSDKQLHLSLS